MKTQWADLSTKIRDVHEGIHADMRALFLHAEALESENESLKREIAELKGERFE